MKRSTAPEGRRAAGRMGIYGGQEGRAKQLEEA